MPDAVFDMETAPWGKRVNSIVRPINKSDCATMPKLFLVTSVLLSLLFSLAADEPAIEQNSVSVSDIGKSVILVGRLGKPLGRQMTIRGKWSLPNEAVKDFDLRFIVTSVNDEPLETPVGFDVAQLKLLTTDHRDATPARTDWKSLDSVEWKLTAYETGYVATTPFRDDNGDPIFPNVRVPHYTEPFTSQLVAVRHLDLPKQP